MLILKQKNSLGAGYSGHCARAHSSTVELAPPLSGQMGGVCCCPASDVERAGNPNAARVASGDAAAAAAAKRFTIVNRSGRGVWWKAGAGRFMDEPGCVDRRRRCRVSCHRSARSHVLLTAHAQRVRRRAYFWRRRAPRAHRPRRCRCLSLAVASAAGGFERRRSTASTSRRVVAARGAPACGRRGVHATRSERRDRNQRHAVRQRKRRRAAPEAAPADDVDRDICGDRAQPLRGAAQRAHGVRAAAHVPAHAAVVA